MGIIARKKTELFMSAHADTHHRQRERDLPESLLDEKTLQEIEVHRYSHYGLYATLLLLLLVHSLI